MKRINGTLAISALIGVMVLAADAFGQGVATQSLGGVQAVLLLVEQAEGKPDPIDLEPLQELAQSTVEDLDLTVLSMEDLVGSSQPRQILRVGLRTTPVAGVNRIYAIDLSLRQEVALLRNPELKLLATTWQAQDLGITPVKDRVEIRESLAGLLARFAVEYRAANPKTVAPSKSPGN